MAIVFTTVFVRGSISEIVLSPLFATQTEPPPVANPAGRLPTGITASKAPVAGSTRRTFPASGSAALRWRLHEIRDPDGAESDGQRVRNPSDLDRPHAAEQAADPQQLAADGLIRYCPGRPRPERDVGGETP